MQHATCNSLRCALLLQVDHGKHGGSGGKLRKALDALDPALRRALGLREEEAPAQWTQDNYYVRQVLVATTTGLDAGCDCRLRFLLFTSASCLTHLAPLYLLACLFAGFCWLDGIPARWPVCVQAARVAKAFEGNVVWAGTVVKYAPADKDGPAW